MLKNSLQLPLPKAHTTLQANTNGNYTEPNQGDIKDYADQRVSLMNKDLSPNNLYSGENINSADLNLNISLRISSHPQINTMPPPRPHSIPVKNGKNWHQKHRPNTPPGYESDESYESFRERKGRKVAKNKFENNGRTLMFSKLSNSTPNVYTNSSLPHFTNRTRYYSSMNGRSHRKSTNQEDIFRRVHGLMERFCSKAGLLQIVANRNFLSISGPLGLLNQSIWDVFGAKSQKPQTYCLKLEVWRKVYLHLTKYIDRFGLFLVGSTMSGLGTEASDMDMCLLVKPQSTDPRYDAVYYLEVIRQALLKSDFAHYPEVIHAKVPILKFRDSQYGFEMDLNCNNSVGIRNTHLLHCYAYLDWRVRPLIIVVKLWAQANEINDAKKMTISSYSLALMVIHYLQCGIAPPVIPCLHGLYPEKFGPNTEIHNIDMQEELDPFYSDNKQTLGQLLTGFLCYYTYFEYCSDAISVRLGARVEIDECKFTRAPKNDHHQWKYLCIEEPFDLTNTARSVYDLETFKRIKRVFELSYNILMDTKNLSYILTRVVDYQR